MSHLAVLFTSDGPTIADNRLYRRYNALPTIADGTPDPSINRKLLVFVTTIDILVVNCLFHFPVIFLLLNKCKGGNSPEAWSKMATANAENFGDKIYDYPGQWTSRCWKVFGFRKVKDGPPSKETLDMSRAICKMCRKSYVNNGKSSDQIQNHFTISILAV